MATPVADEEICHLVHRHGSADRAAAAIARRQLGVITVRQLELAGLGPRMRAGRVARGWLTRLHRGVYQWGAVTPPPGAIELSGCLACGPRSYASHASGAALWLLAEGGTEMAHVTVVGHNHRSRVGLRVYRVARLHPADIAQVGGIPVTAPARTLLDLASMCTGGVLERALSEAFARQLVAEPDLRSCLARAPGRAGAAALRGLLDSLQGPRITRSEAERALLALIRQAGLPAPHTNVRVGRFVVDAFWPQAKLVVEIDGYAVHGHRQAFERDRGRDQAIVAAGYRVMRITWRQLNACPLLVAANLAAALARAPAPGQ